MAKLSASERRMRLLEKAERMPVEKLRAAYVRSLLRIEKIEAEARRARQLQSAAETERLYAMIR